MLKQLGRDEHLPTTSTARKHLFDFQPPESADSQDDLLQGAAKIVADVSPQQTDDKITVAGVVDAILRFQGVFLSARNDTEQCTAKILEKISSFVTEDSV